MRLFHRKGQAVKNWHYRALIIDIRKTRLTIIETGDREKKAPTWAHEK